MKTKHWLILLTAILGLSLIVAGCGSSDTTTDGEQAEQPAASPEQASTEDERKRLEIFSWWTGAGEEAGLLALIELFQEKYPDVEVINAAVAGGAGTNAQAVLASRMQGDDPPDTFQIHGGAALNTGWAAAGKMEPLNDLYEEEGWYELFPQDLIDMVTSDGHIYSVPVNIHRSNVLWYNIAIFEEHGLTPPTTFDEFFTVAETLQANGVTPLALGDREPWTAAHLLESVMLGVLGAEGYNQLWSGELAFDSPEFREVMEIFSRILDYVNDDHAARNWQDAAQMVANGEAAMNVMGDWAAGYFATDLQLVPNQDFGWVAPPGTEGMFMVVTDTFGLPKGVEDPEVVKDFLRVLGSVEGQDVFNPLKGSIPARVDADVSKYNEYGQQTIAEFRESVLTPSLAHNSAAPAGFVQQFNQAVNIFVSSRNIDQFIDAVQAAQNEHIQ